MLQTAMDGVYSHRTDEGHIILQDASDVEFENVLLNATDVKDVSWSCESCNSDLVMSVISLIGSR